MLQQFFVCAEEEDGTDLTLFVTAYNPVQAVDIWVKHYEQWNIIGIAPKVYAVPAVGAVARAHPWHTEVVMAYESDPLPEPLVDVEDDDDD